MTARQAGMMSLTTSVLSAKAARLTVHAQSPHCPVMCDAQPSRPLLPDASPRPVHTWQDCNWRRPPCLSAQTNPLAAPCATLQPYANPASCLLPTRAAHPQNLCAHVLRNLP